MDPSTVILLLALNLIGIGGLLFLIGERMSERAGLRGFATGSVVFGLAYLLRLSLGPSSASLAGVVADAGMIYATLCFATGLRQFSARPPLGRRATLGWVALYVLVAVPAILLWQSIGRHAVLNLALAAAYLTLAALAASAARREAQTLRPPLRVLAGMIGLLGLTTGVRGLLVPFVGVEPLFVGLGAQVYYGYATVVTVILGPNLLWMVFVRLNDRLAELATHDPLTGLLNRNGLDDALQRHFGGRPPRALVLLQVDVDHFKRVNDQHGHAVGDAVLRAVAHTLASQVRAADFVARLGGEEFLVACDGADVDQAAALADRLRLAVASQAHPVPGGPALHCTVSIGVSRSFDARAHWEAALRDADRALYQAKQGGRDRVVLAAPQEASA